MATMQAAVFQGKGKISIREVPKPEPGAGEALLRTSVTTICGTDVHILKGEYPVRDGLIIGHEPVGTIESVGPSVTSLRPGGTLSSLGVYSGHVTIPLDAFAAGLGDHHIAQIEEAYDLFSRQREGVMKVALRP